MERTIVKMLFGSQVYGTSTPDSDEDFKRIFIPNPRDILLQRATKTSRNSSTGDPHGKNGAGDVDLEEFSLHGYMKLLCDGQTVAMDMLFVPEEHVVVASPTWREIVHNRKWFISSNVAPFVGYCRAQANKYGIKGSRMAAAEAAAKQLRLVSEEGKRSDRLSDWAPLCDALTAHEHIEIVTRKHPQSDTIVPHLSVCGKLAPYTLKLWRAADMYEDLFARYGARARAAKDNAGIDWKALMHAVRIQQQAVELLSTGAIEFPRPNAAELLRIRLGERPYVEVAEQIEQGMVALDAAMEASTLPSKPDRAAADGFVHLVYAHEVAQA